MVSNTRGDQAKAKANLTGGRLIKTCAHIGGFVAFTQQLLVFLLLRPPVTVAVRMQNTRLFLTNNYNNNKNHKNNRIKCLWQIFEYNIA